jgi:hypothetical protein
MLLFLFRYLDSRDGDWQLLIFVKSMILTFLFFGPNSSKQYMVNLAIKTIGNDDERQAHGDGELFHFLHLEPQIKSQDRQEIHNQKQT